MNVSFSVAVRIKPVRTRVFVVYCLFYNDEVVGGKCSLTVSMNLQEMAVAVLNMPFISGKCRMTYIFAKHWKERKHDIGAIDVYHYSRSDIPLEPGRTISNLKRTTNLEALDAKKIFKNCKSSLVYTLHGIANAESYAIDLFWDLIARFYDYEVSNCCRVLSQLKVPISTASEREVIPASFFDDMVFIATQEADHFLSWKQRLLTGYGCVYGSLPSNGGLWQSAIATSGNLLARLAVINLTHEAKGLDTYCKTREKLENGGDLLSRDILDRNYKEEIHHVATGVKWFKWLCERCDADPVLAFHRLSIAYFKGRLYPPFNHQARQDAGLEMDWYMPLAQLS